MFLSTIITLLGAGYAAGQLEGRGFPDCSSGPLSDNDVCDSSLDPLARATALIELFTIEEKLNNTGYVSPGVPRLGLPAYTWWQEALHGVAGSPGVNYSDSGEFSYATSFPQPILMGAAFDDELIRDVATVVSTEARAFSNAVRSGLDFWTPNINPFRDPRWGRGQETPGEDPFHLSSYVHSLIDGLQGGLHPEYKRVAATCKHFAGYDMEDWNGNFRFQWDAHINPQDLVEYYMPPFETCARDSNVAAFMCTYNALNGVPTCADPWLLQTVLREHWGWTNEQQWVTSDCGSIQNVYKPHNYAKTREEAVAMSLVAGTDIDCGSYYQQNLPKAYAQGLFNESVLDQSLIRQYSSLVRLGYFDASIPYRSIGWSDVNTPAAQDLAYKAAAEGITVLKNDGALPMNITSDMTVVIVGGWADATELMQGNYFGPAPYVHSPTWALNQTGAKVYSASVPSGQGDPTTDGWLPVWNWTQQADLVIYAGGIDNSVEAEGMDRSAVAWSGAQLDMIEQIASYGVPCVVLQMGGGQLDSSPIANNPNVSALIWGGYPGQDGGPALIDTITGKNAPAGRLPTTQYPAGYISQVPMTEMSLRPNNETGSPGQTYRWYTGEPTFEFGSGLHYTDFSASVQEMQQESYSISALMNGCSERYMDRCAFETVGVDVENTGSRTSDYVTLAFLTGEHGPEPHPNKRLVNYTRLHDVEAGQTQTANLNLTLGSLARVDEMGNKMLYPGEYALMIDIQPLAMVNFTLTGEAAVLEEWPQAPPPRWQTSDYFVGGYGSTYREQILGVDDDE